MVRVLSRLRHQRGGRGLLMLLGAGSLIIALLGPITLWAAPVTGLHGKERADVINATRQVLLTAAGGLALLTGAVFTNRTFYLSRRGQLTDRYTQAISLLASEKITERLGGVYALEHLMIESERDHQTSVEVLAAFVRERAPIENLGAVPGSDSTAPVPSPPRPRWVPRPATDVDAALTVLRRRPQRPEHHAVNMARTNLSGADLAAADLRGANLHGTRLRLAWLVGAQLQGASLDGAQLTAYLMEANLQDAYVQNADLEGAQLRAANLHRANFHGSTLTNADLSEANLQGANLSEADLHGANLQGAQLQGAILATDRQGSPASARGLTVDQLAAAVMDDTTRLPDELRSALRIHNHPDQ